VSAGEVIVLGIGNLLNSDEGVGIHALRRLQEEVGNRFPQVSFLDGGTLGLNLLPMVEPEGSVIELGREEIPLYSGIKMSQHQTTFQEVLGLAALRGRLPEHLHLIGVQPASLEIGTTLSPEVADALPQVVERAAQRLAAWMTELAQSA
jgi:hydrogenase maturation protease